MLIYLGLRGDTAGPVPAATPAKRPA
jgi:hypothetical protein